MKDPMRLEEGQPTAFEQQLFDAARRQIPGAALKARMQEGIGIAGPPSPVPAPVAVVVKSFALGWKANLVLALVAVGASVTVPLVLNVRDRRPTTSPPTPPAATQLPSSASDLSRVSPPAVVETNASGSLTEEIGLLDRVRGSMADQQPRRALAELQQYDERYPHGRFRPEAIVLRIEALVRAQDKQSARLLGQQFMTLYPKNPLADRVAKILQP